MRPIEILLGVLFPMFIAVGLAMATTGTTSLEFAVARIGFFAAAINLAGLVVWWIYKLDLGLWQYAIGVVIFAFIVVSLPIILRWLDVKEELALKKGPVNAGILFSSVDPKSATRSIEIGDSGLKFGSFNFFGVSTLKVELIGGVAKVSTDVRNDKGEMIGQIDRNVWKVKPEKAWDFNYNDYALEVKNPEGRIVLQVKVLPDTIQIQGEWWDSQGDGVRLLKPPEGGMKAIRFNPQTVDDPSYPKIQPIFKYPSDLYLGEMLK